MSRELVDLILDSVYENQDFGSRLEKMNTINFLRLYFDTYDFYTFADTHEITESEYKTYFKFDVKYHNLCLHKKIKKDYKKSKGAKKWKLEI